MIPPRRNEVVGVNCLAGPDDGWGAWGEEPT